MTMRGVAPPQVTMAHIFQAVVPYVIMSLLLLALLLLRAGHRHLAAELAHWIRRMHDDPTVAAVLARDLAHYGARRCFGLLGTANFKISHALVAARRRAHLGAP